MIYFHKILAYALTPTAGDAFSYLDDLTMQRIDPPSLCPQAFEAKTPIVFHSPLQRAKDILRSKSDQRTISLNELAEIPFSMKALCTPLEWSQESSAVVRRRFKEAFIADTLPIRRSVLEQQIKSLLLQCSREEDVTVISHSFRLKLIEAYVLTKGTLFQDPLSLHAHLHDDEQTYDWGQGFTIDGRGEELVQEPSFSFLHPIGDKAPGKEGFHDQR